MHYSVVDRRTLLKAATGAAAQLCAWGIPGKSYQRALAQDDLVTRILAFPGSGGQPTEADMERVGELCLQLDEAWRFCGPNGDLHRRRTTPVITTTSSGPCPEPGRSSPAQRSQWIDVPQDEIFPKVQQGVATGEIEFDIMEGGAPWEGDILGHGPGSRHAGLGERSDRD